MPDVFLAFFELMALTHDYRQELHRFLIGCVAIACFVWGRGPEKACASAWVVLYSGSGVVMHMLVDPVHFTNSMIGVPPVTMETDLVLFLSFLLLALSANRQYVFWLAGWRLMASLGDAARAIDETIAPLIYVVLKDLPDFMCTFIIFGGLIAQIRREKGRYADWVWQVAPRSAKSITD